MGRPTKESQSEGLYLKEQFQGIDTALNELEAICKSPNVDQKEDYAGAIGLLVGKIQMRVINLEQRLDVYGDVSED